MTINLSEFEQYFPEVNKPVVEGDYTFTIKILENEEKNIYIINLKINQKDIKENNLIKFRFGLGKDKPTDSLMHSTDKPHFEISLYKREKSSYSANIYFTFNTSFDEEVREYIGGTIVLIKEILENFQQNYDLRENLLDDLIYSNLVKEDLSKFKKKLITALVECYKKHDLIVRTTEEKLIIKTEHNFDKYLNKKDLLPLYRSLKEHM